MKMRDFEITLYNMNNIDETDKITVKVPPCEFCWYIKTPEEYKQTLEIRHYNKRKKLRGDLIISVDIPENWCVISGEVK